MYSGFLLLILGFSIGGYGFFSGIISDIAILYVLQKRAKMEEHLLEKRFGEEYREYKRRTGKYFFKLKRPRFSGDCFM